MAKNILRRWKTVSRQTILEHSKFLTVESHTIKLPDGRVIDNWPWIIIPDAVIVLAKTITGQYLCFRQTKYAVEGVSLAPVAGMLEPDEHPTTAAKRELLEETGYIADTWIDLGSYAVDPNRGVGKVYLFLAKDACRVAEADSDDLEDQLLLELTAQELLSALRRGEFKVVSWSACVGLALLHEQEFT